MPGSPIKNAVVLWIICQTVTLQAQVYFGFRAGVNLANVSTTEDGAITKDRISGAHASFFLDLGIGNHMAIQPEWNFVQRGFRRHISQTNDWYYTLNYLDIAVLSKYRFEIKRNKLNGFSIAGPYIAKAISGQRKNQYDNEVQKQDLFNGGVPLIRADLGILFGGGIGIPLGRGSLLVDLRYSFGLLNINEHYLADGNIRNHGIIISAGYVFQ